MTVDRLRWVGTRTNELRAPMVGRVRELSHLADLFAGVVKEREPRLVLLTGPSGIGKTRLVEEATARLDPGARVLTVSARGARSLGPMGQLLRSRLGVVATMTEDAARAHVRSEVSTLLGDRKVGDVLYYLGQVMELPFPESPLTKAVAEDADEAARLARPILRRVLEADAAQRPLVLVFDDLDEARPEELDRLAALAASVAGPVLFVAISRTDLRHRTGALGLVPDARRAELELEALTDAEARTVAEALLARCGTPPRELVDEAISAAGGNPLLLHRMVLVFLDTGVLEVERSGTLDDTWRVHLERLDRATLRLSVEDAVEARMAALSSDERRLLEHAAAMGSVFWIGGLRALARAEHAPPELWVEGDDFAPIRAMLEGLVARDYVLSLPDSTFSGEEEYVFKHNKERERLSSGTSPDGLRGYHQIIADWLEHKAGVRSHEEHVGMLARHRELAGARTRAALSYLEAGTIARARFAQQRAADYYKKGLELLGHRDGGRRVDALHNYGDVLLALGLADPALAQFREMLTLAWRFDMRAKGGAAHNRIGRLYRDTGRLDEAAHHLSAGLTLFSSVDDERGVASSRDDIGKLHWMRGHYRRAIEELKMALSMRRRLGDRRGIALSLNNIGAVLQDSGEYGEALRSFEQSLTIRREIEDLVGISQSQNNLGTVAQDMGDHERALGLFEEALATARLVGDKNRIALVLTNVGEAHYRLGNVDESIRILEQAEALCDELGDKLGLAEVMRGLGKAHMLRGEFTKARRYVARSVDLFTAVKSPIHLGTAVRTLGEVTAAGGWGPEHVGKAEDYFVRAISIFEDIGNAMEAARAEQAFAEFLRAQGEVARADELAAKAAEIFLRARSGTSVGDRTPLAPPTTSS